MINCILTDKVKVELYNTLNIYRRVITYRSDKLFTYFLPIGYQHIMLTSVAVDFHDDAMLAKLHLGMLITLLDDFADHPDYHDSRLVRAANKTILDTLYFDTCQLNLCDNHPNLTPHQQDVLSLVNYLLNQLLKRVKLLPHYSLLKSLFEFDMARIAHANDWSNLAVQQSGLHNSFELEQIRPFNMGMVMAGMIDIMATPNINMNEIGVARHIFHLGQRYGSISNNVNTFSREWNDGDISNEIILKGFERMIIDVTALKSLSAHAASERLITIFRELDLESDDILQELAMMSRLVVSCNMNDYIDGLKKLNILHEKMRGVI